MTGSRRVLAFRHVPFEGLGLIEPPLRERGFEIDYVDAYLPDATVPAVHDYRALIFMGGPMSVNDDLPYLRREESILREAIKRRQSVLGVCLGAQLLAKSLGARIYRNAAKEIGWHEVRFTEAAAADPVFAGLRRETIFHWHGETFDLPEGAQLLASSELCRNQAFRSGSCYGLQFHLEVTPGMISEWCQEDANCGDVRELEAPVDPQANSERLVVLSRLIFGRWIELLGRR